MKIQRLAEGTITKTLTGFAILLLALPQAWPTGSLHGLRARGGFVGDIEWKNGQVSTYHIRSKEPREVKVRVHGELKTIKAEYLE